MKRYALKYFLRVITSAVCLTLSVTTTPWATPARDYDLPEPLECRAKPITPSMGEVNKPFEYKAFCRARIPVESVEIYFTNTGTIEFDYEFPSFKGALGKNQTVSWIIKGKVIKKIPLKDGSLFDPFIQMNIKYTYPVKAAEKEIRRKFKEGDIEGPFTLEYALKKLARRFPKKEQIKFQRVWPP